MHGTWEPVVLMLREKLKRKPRKSESTDAKHRDGPERTSDEISVMEIEQRSPGHSAMNMGQSVMKGTHGQSKAIYYF